MKKYLLFVLIFFLVTCNKSPTGTDNESTLQYADLTKLHWTVDTLKINDPEAYTIMHAMWGSAADDIWVGGDHREIFYGKLWHYDGQSWQREHTAGMNGLEIDEIWGFSATDIWAVGQRLSPPSQTEPVNEPIGVILHYDGTSWKEVFLPAKNFAVTALGGTGPTDIYAGGGPKGIMYHYDGTRWMLDSIYVPVKFSQAEGNETFISRITRSIDGEDVFLLQNVRRNWEVVPHPYLYKRENDKWVLKDSNNVFLNFQKIWMSPKQTLYLVGGEIATWSEETGFVEIDAPQGVEWLGIDGWENNLLVCGRSDDNTKGILYQYDGYVWTPIENIPTSNIYIFQPFFIEKSVFLRAQTISTFPIHTFIFKGVL